MRSVQGFSVCVLTPKKTQEWKTLDKKETDEPF